MGQRGLCNCRILYFVLHGVFEKMVLRRILAVEGLGNRAVEKTT